MSLPQTRPIRVTIWHEYRHERTHEVVRKHYPAGMHATLAEAVHEHLGSAAEVRTATLDEPDHGLTDALLDSTDVMTWWGHKAHNEVTDHIAQKVCDRVLAGMGIIFLHSAHVSKPFRKLMGTTGSLQWREAGELERVWCVNPAHEIADGIPNHFEIPHEEMYGEHFDIPAPDELVFLSWFEGGNVFRSGCAWTRGKGKIFYFRPGHETFPTYHHPQVRRVIANAIRWAAPRSTSPYSATCPNAKISLSPITSTYVVDESIHKH